MNNRFTPTDARRSNATRSLAPQGGLNGMSLWNGIGVALHHSPGEGCRGSS